MTITVTLPDSLASQLQTKAETQQVSIVELVIDLLTQSLEPKLEKTLTLEELVAEIKATPPDPANFHPARGSLAEALRNAPDDPEFDLERWNKEWEAVEIEMKAITQANNIAEGFV